MRKRYEENLTDVEIRDFILWAKKNIENFHLKCLQREYSQQFYVDNYPEYLKSLKK